MLTRRAVVLAAVALRGCATAPPEEVAAVTEYLECIDCARLALQTVVALGDTALPALRWALERGPSPARVERERAIAVAALERIRRYAERHPAPPHAAADTHFVADALMRLDGRTRLRAAHALLRIGTPNAVDAVCRAARRAPTVHADSALRVLIRDAGVRC